MITILKALFIILLMKLITCNNPVKIRLMLTTISFIIIVIIKEMSGMSWIPLILSMLFTGGILIMFIILSSITPNEPIKKNKKRLHYNNNVSNISNNNTVHKNGNIWHENSEN